jgi:hypothetical protein
VCCCHSLGAILIGMASTSTLPFQANGVLAQHDPREWEQGFDRQFLAMEIGP